DPLDDAKKVMRREKNRAAAQRSRMKQIQKTDILHMESEKLERENAALRREVMQLTEEVKYLSMVLSHHEALCSAVDRPYLINHHSSHHRGLCLALVTPSFYHL
ncbi:basic leucine zipper transcriptional factor ATF-like, partial [Scleropages formosus]